MIVHVFNAYSDVSNSLHLIRNKIEGAKNRCIALGASHSRKLAQIWGFFQTESACMYYWILSFLFHRGLPHMTLNKIFPQAQQLRWWNGVLGRCEGIRQEDWRIFVRGGAYQKTEGFQVQVWQFYICVDRKAWYCKYTSNSFLAGPCQHHIISFPWDSGGRHSEVGSWWWFHTAWSSWEKGGCWKG